MEGTRRGAVIPVGIAVTGGAWRCPAQLRVEKKERMKRLRSDWLDLSKDPRALADHDLCVLCSRPSIELVAGVTQRVAVHTFFLAAHPPYRKQEIGRVESARSRTLWW